MRAMILAAGRGERMRPLTDHTPKPLLKVGGKSLIAWQIERLKEAGIVEIIINHAYLGEQIETQLGDGAKSGVNIQYSAETKALETAGGIANAMPLLTDYGKDNSPFLVVNGDIFTDMNYRLIQLGAQDLMHLVMVPNPPQHSKGDFGVQDGRLVNNSDKTFTFSGVGIYHPSVFEEIKAEQPYPLAPLIREAIASNQAAATLHQGIWHDIGTPERLHALDLVLSNSH